VTDRLRRPFGSGAGFRQSAPKRLGADGLAGVEGLQEAAPVVGRVGEQVSVRALAVDVLDARPHSSGEREEEDPAADRRARCVKPS